MTSTRVVRHSIRTRILATLGIMGISYLALLAIVEFSAGATHRHTDRVSSTLFPATLQLQQGEASYEQLKRRYKEAVLLEDPAALADANKDADATASALSGLSISSRSRETYGALVASRDNVPDGLQASVAALAADNNRLTAAMQQLDDSLDAQGREEFRATAFWSSRSRAAGWVGLVLGLIGFAGTWWILQYKVILPLDRLGRRMRDIAQGAGDLTGRVDVRGHNELDEVGRWFNVFIERVEQIVLEVAASARAVSAAAAGLASIAHETASHSVTQHDQAMNIADSMGEISVSVRQISETAQSAARDAHTAEQNANAGGVTIRSTVDAIQQLLAASQQTANKIEELGRASDAIGAVTGVIDDIAGQTSLLALNASIEAARAGEHGRGFAVVASEVRRLAERTSRATQEIDQTVRAIQTGTAEVVDAVRSSMTQVESGVASARSAGNALASILEGSEAMQQMVTEIAAASTQQSHATQSVNGNIQEISRIIECTTVSSAHAVEACDRLSTLAGDLNKLVGVFRVREPAPPLAPVSLPSRPLPASRLVPAEQR